MHEHLAEPQEKDVGESQGNAYSDIPADASPTFLRGKGHSHHRQYESGERKGKARILFNKREFDIGIPAHPLSVNELVQLFVCQCLNRLFSKIEVLDGQVNDSIKLSSAPYMVSQVIVILPLQNTF